MNTIDRLLDAAVMGLPLPLALSMERALAEGQFPIQAGRYDSGTAMCPLGAADAYAEAHGLGRVEGGEGKHYGARVLRFAISFDLCAEQLGVERAVELLRGVLMHRVGSVHGCSQLRGHRRNDVAGLGVADDPAAIKTWVQ